MTRQALTQVCLGAVLLWRLANASALVQTIGLFDISFDQNKLTILTHPDAFVKQVVYEGTLPFITARSISEQVEEYSGMFRREVSLLDECRSQSVDSLKPGGNSSIILSGALCNTPYQMILSASTVSPQQLSFNISTLAPSKWNQLALSADSVATEAVYGFGSQYSYFNMKGLCFSLFSEEQGVGRGKQPLTYLLNHFRNYSGGDAFTTYTFVPFFMTTRLRSIYLLNTQYIDVDLTSPSSIVLRATDISPHQPAVFLAGTFIAAQSLPEIIKEYTKFSGRMKPLPQWIGSGAVVGMEGGTAPVSKRLDEALRQTNGSFPVAALWLQDWSGARKFSDRVGLWWNWEVDSSYYTGWTEFIQTLRQKHGIRMMTYINPMVTNLTMFPDAPHYKQELFSQGVHNGYLVQVNGSVALEYSGSGIVDLTNPAAREWYKKVIIANLLNVAGGENGTVFGWMHDFGEAIPLTAELFQGDARDVHNQYPAMWQQLAQEAIAESGLSTKDQEDVVYFARSGTTNSPAVTRAFWLGDQLVSWDQYDGLKSAVVGLITSGLSGYAIQHSDIGGYTVVEFGSLRYVRSKELFLRWAEFAAFTSIYRSHPGSNPAPPNWQFDSDLETLAHFALFARVFAALQPYRAQLMQEASDTGMPLARALVLHYPADSNVFNLTTEFLLGADVLVAPTTDPQSTVTSVYLPGTRVWRHMWSLHDYQPGTYSISTPTGAPAVFYRVGSLAAALLAPFAHTIK